MDKRKVLVIEDETGIANVIKAILHINNIEAVFAHNGLNGLKLLEEEDISLVLCDVMLPDINGYQVLEWVKRDADRSRIPFIFLTALADQADIKRGMDSGADDYITKPFGARVLLDAIRSRMILQ